MTSPPNSAAAYRGCGPRRPLARRLGDILALALCCMVSAAAPFAAASALSQPPRLRLERGISLAGWFTWARADSVGRYQPSPFRALGQVSDRELAMLRCLGFDFVRLPVDPGVLLDVRGAARAQLFGKIGATLARLQRAGFSIIWDYHPRAQRYLYSYNAFFADDAPMATDYRALLAQTARFLGRFPADRTALELINEPPLHCRLFSGSYNRLIEAAYHAARAGNKHLPLIMEGGCFAAIDSLPAFDLAPYRNDPAALFTFHFYEPAAFVQQGNTDATSVAQRNMAGLPYPALGDERQPLALLRVNLAGRQFEPWTAPLSSAQQQDALAIGRRQIERYLDTGADTTWINQQFDRVSGWATTERIDPRRILLGEFSTMRRGRNRGAADADRGRWIADVRRAAERRRLPWAYWAYFDPLNRMSLVLAPERRLDTVVVRSLGLLDPMRVGCAMVSS